MTGKGDPRAPLFRALRAQVGDQFQAEGERVVSILTTAHQAGTLPAEALAHAVQAVRDGHGDWQALFTDAFDTISQHAGQSVLDQFIKAGVLPKGTTYAPTREGSQSADARKTFPKDSAQHVTDTTADALSGLADNNQLAASIDGSDMEAIIAGVQAQYDAWQTGRTNTIADTEVVKGWSLGKLDAAFQAADITGGDPERTWASAGDSHVRPDHAAADGQTVGLHEPFDVGGEQLMYPGDPSGSPGNTINCRCDCDYALTLTTGNGGADAGEDEEDEEEDDGSEAKARKARRAAFRAFREVTLG